MEAPISESEARALEQAACWGYERECTGRAEDHATAALATSCAVCAFLFRHSAGLIYFRRHERARLLRGEGLRLPEQGGPHNLPW